MIFSNKDEFRFWISIYFFKSKGMMIVLKFNLFGIKFDFCCDSFRCDSLGDNFEGSN